MTKKIILIGPKPPPYTGQSVSFKMLIEGFKERQYEVSVIDIASRYESLGNKNVFRRALEYAESIFEYFRSVCAKGDIVYLTIAQSRRGFWRDLIFIWLASFLKKRIVLHLKGGNYDNFYNEQPVWLKSIIRKTLNQASVIVVLSKSLIKMYDFAPELSSKIKVVLNGLPNHNNRSQYGKVLSNGKVRLLYLSNLIESKGYMDVLESVRVLKEKHGINVVCHFCGEFKSSDDDLSLKTMPIQERKKMFEEKLIEYDLQENVKLMGVVEGKEKEQELLNANFFILPTNYNNEGQPVSIIEALSYGCVIISTNYRAIPDMLHDGINGAFVDYGQPEQIAYSIYNLTKDNGLYEEMSKNSIKIFNKSFTREAHLSNLIKTIVGE